MDVFLVSPPGQVFLSIAAAPVIMFFLAIARYAMAVADYGTQYVRQMRLQNDEIEHELQVRIGQTVIMQIML